MVPCTYASTCCLMCNVKDPQDDMYFGNRFKGFDMNLLHMKAQAYVSDARISRLTPT